MTGRLLLLLIFLLLARPAPAAIRARLLVSNPSPYIGEAIRLTLEIRRPAQVAAPLRPLWPALTDLLLVAEPPGQVRRLVDAPGTVVEHLHRIVRPLRAGSLRVAGAAVLQGGRRTAIPPLTLHVRALPRRNRPPSFDGAVGRLGVSVRPDRAAGTLEIVLTGDADSRLLAAPRTSDTGRELLLLTSRERGRWPDRQRLLRYRLPADGRFRLSLSWFDPADGRYHRVVHPRPFAWRPRHLALLPVLLLLAWAGRRGWRLRQLDRLLRDDLAGLPYAERLEHLRRAGIEDRLLAELAAHWHRTDRRFAPDAPATGEKGRDRLRPPLRLRWKMAAGIDKRRLLRP